MNFPIVSLRGLRDHVSPIDARAKHVTNSTMMVSPVCDTRTCVPDGFIRIDNAWKQVQLRIGYAPDQQPGCQQSGNETSGNYARIPMPTHVYTWSSGHDDCFVDTCVLHRSVFFDE